LGAKGSWNQAPFWDERLKISWHPKPNVIAVAEPIKLYFAPPPMEPNYAAVGVFPKLVEAGLAKIWSSITGRSLPQTGLY